MTRLFRSTPAPQGELAIKQLSPNSVEVYYLPPTENIARAGLDPEDESGHRVKLLLIDDQDRSITIFPINTLAGKDDFLEPKYRKIERITLNDTASFSFRFETIFDEPDFQPPVPSTTADVIEILEDLPSGFTKDYDFGLGLAKDYRVIIRAVETLSDCTDLIISSTHPTGIDQGAFYISEADFQEMVTAINRITRRAQAASHSVKSATAFNILAKRLGVPEVQVRTGRHPLSRLLIRAAEGLDSLPEEEQAALLDAIEQNTQSFARAEPKKLAKLKNDFELLALESLIKRFEEMIGRRLTESQWQAFFNANPFILSLAFGYPVIKIQDQASVGGHKLSGSGQKITDFLIKNSLTNNTAIVEIKTPQTELLNKKAFRDGIYTPSGEFSGAINQALDQKYRFQSEIAQIKVNSRLYDIESYAVHCCLLVGITPTGNDRLKSFELFRRNSKDVEIVTFNELLVKAKQLHAFLASVDD